MNKKSLKQPAPTPISLTEPNLTDENNYIVENDQELPVIVQEHSIDSEDLPETLEEYMIVILDAASDSNFK